MNLVKTVLLVNCLILFSEIALSLEPEVSIKGFYSPKVLVYSDSLIDEHMLLVDKNRQSLQVFDLSTSKPTLIESFRASTGKKDGDKRVEGDRKTPEGIYFFNEIIENENLPPRYGVRAFVTNYPNLFDRKARKKGSGIWLHGLNRTLAAKDTKGCVALDNQDIETTTQYVKLGKTPIIIADNIDFDIETDDSGKEAVKSIKRYLDAWSQAWQQKDTDLYMDFYSPQFYTNRMNKNRWRLHKSRLNQKYKTIKVNLWDRRFYLYNKQLMISMNLYYVSDSYLDYGRKTLYLRKEQGKWLIIAEGWDTPDELSPLPEKLVQLYCTKDRVQQAVHGLASLKQLDRKCPNDSAIKTR